MSRLHDLRGTDRDLEDNGSKFVLVPAGKDGPEVWIKLRYFAPDAKRWQKAWAEIAKDHPGTIDDETALSLDRVAIFNAAVVDWSEVTFADETVAPVNLDSFIQLCDEIPRFLTDCERFARNRENFQGDKDKAVKNSPTSSVGS